MEFFHLINRGVEKRDVFLKDGDYIRFIHDMYVFNDTRSAPNYVVKERQSKRQRKLLLHIHAFCLMPNHYHLLVSLIREGGISLFMQKLNMGYAKYFNEKYERTGVLWQGVFRKQHVVRDAHFIYIPYYIHLNPLDFKYPDWRKGGLRNSTGALAYLRKYRWSSHLDYCGIRNFPSVTYRPYLTDIFGSRSRYEKEIRTIISDPKHDEASSDIEL